MSKALSQNSVGDTTMQVDFQLFVFIILSVMFFVLGVIAGDEHSNKKWEKDAISQGHAQYNPTNAKFEWIKK